MYYTLIQPNGSFALSSVVDGGGGRKSNLSSEITASGTCTLKLDPAGAGASALALALALAVTITRYNPSP